jgi:hypothetical protein
MIFDSVNDGLDQIIGRTRHHLVLYRAEHDDDDEEFVRRLVHQFVDQAAKMPHGAGAISMAMSAYRLAKMTIEMDEMRDALEMREAGLQLMWAIADHADEERRDGQN